MLRGNTKPGDGECRGEDYSIRQGAQGRPVQGSDRSKDLTEVMSGSCGCLGKAIPGRENRSLKGPEVRVCLTASHKALLT